MDQHVTVVAGGYLGDEGKGKATQFFCGEHQGPLRALCIRAGGGTNTGATVWVSETTKLGIHMLPVGAFMADVDAYIGSGCYVNLDILEKELAEREHTMLAVGNPFFGRIFLSKNAHIVTPEILKEDADKEKAQNLGSTKNGVSTAASYKYRYAGLRVADLMGRPTKLSSIIERYKVEVVDPFELFEDIIMRKGYSIVIEGTQGIGLDVNHGFHYPHVSAGSFSTYGLLDGVGYALAPDEVCMVLKAYGSYFGPSRMAGDFEDNEFRKHAGEFGTTTGRPRNLCWLEGRLLRKAASLIRPSYIMLNRLDTLNWFAENGKKWGFLLDDGHLLSFSEKAIVKGNLTAAGALFVEMIESYTKAPVSLIGTGPKHTDTIER
jgi:adenylosuccinate synthase